MSLTITPLPTPPSRTVPFTFPADADAFLGALPQFVSETNALGNEVEGHATEAAQSVFDAAAQVALAATQVSLATIQQQTATNQATISTNQAIAAAASANITAWISGTIYTQGKVVYSLVDFQPYIRTINGAGTVDPSADSINWAIFNVKIPMNIPYYQSLGGL